MKQKKYFLNVCMIYIGVLVMDYNTSNESASSLIGDKMKEKVLAHQLDLIDLISCFRGLWVRSLQYFNC